MKKNCIGITKNKPYFIYTFHNLNGNVNPRYGILFLTFSSPFIL